VERIPEKDGKRQVRLARGSRYHVGTGEQGEEFLGQLLGVLPGPDGRFTRPWMRLQVNDALLDVAHRQSVMIRYRSTPLEREIGFFLERAARTRMVLPRHVVLVRSHVHGPFREYQDGGIIAVSTPSWKLQDDFATLSVSPNRLFSEHIGGVGLHISEDEVKVTGYVYEHPELPVEEIL